MSSKSSDDSNQGKETAVKIWLRRRKGGPQAQYRPIKKPTSTLGLGTYLKSLPRGASGQLEKLAGAWSKTGPVRRAISRAWAKLNPKSKVILVSSAFILILAICFGLIINYPNAYGVMIDGKQVAVVDDWNTVESALDRIVQDAGGDRVLGVNEKISPKKLRVEDATFTPAEDLDAILRQNLDFTCQAAGIEINGKNKVWVADTATAQQVLEDVKNYFAPQGSDVELLKLDFQEQVAVKDDQVSSGEILSTEDAESLLKNGTIKLVTHTIKKGETLWTIAQQNNMYVGDLLDANPGLEEDGILNIGDEIKLAQAEPIVHVESEYKYKTTESIPYATTYVPESDMWKGLSETTRSGVNGEKEVVYQVCAVNGIQTSREALQTTVNKEPVARIVARGTRMMVASRGGGSGRLGWPLRGPITSPYGYRHGEFHPAIDIDGVTGDPIRAAADGTVYFTGWSGSYGQLIAIDHGDGLMTRYAHCSRIDVVIGDKVTRGQVIGLVGNTGHSTGSHLHFEVLVNGQPNNPLNYLN